MDLNKDSKLTFDEFKEGSKQDPTIVQVSRTAATCHDNRSWQALSLYDGLV